MVTPIVDLAQADRICCHGQSLLRLCAVVSARGHEWNITRFELIGPRLPRVVWFEVYATKWYCFDMQESVGVARSSVVEVVASRRRSSAFDLLTWDGKRISI